VPRGLGEGANVQQSSCCCRTYCHNTAQHFCRVFILKDTGSSPHLSVGLTSVRSQTHVAILLLPLRPLIQSVAAIKDAVLADVCKMSCMENMKLILETLSSSCRRKCWVDCDRRKFWRWRPGSQQDWHGCEHLDCFFGRPGPQQDWLATKLDWPIKAAVNVHGRPVKAAVCCKREHAESNAQDSLFDVS